MLLLQHVLNLLCYVIQVWVPILSESLPGTSCYSQVPWLLLGTQVALRYLSYSQVVQLLSSTLVTPKYLSYSQVPQLLQGSLVTPRYLGYTNRYFSYSQIPCQYFQVPQLFTGTSVIPRSLQIPLETSDRLSSHWIKNFKKIYSVLKCILCPTSHKSHGLTLYIK